MKFPKGHSSPHDQTMLDQFHKVLTDPPPKGRQKEQVVQDFLELHSELIPTPNLLNHHLHFEMVISKFPLGTELTTDYVYLTKSSDTWRVTLVELESPDKEIFTNDTRRATTSATFNAALGQIRSWKAFLDENKQEFVRRLDPMLQPHGMRKNRIEFAYQLIIGRSENKNFSEDRRRQFNQIGEGSGVFILTYDQLVDYYESGQPYKKLILRRTGSQYAFKHMHFEPNQLLAYLGPDSLQISDEEAAQLASAGYDVDRWRSGELLVANVKYTNSSFMKSMAEGLILPKKKS